MAYAPPIAAPPAPAPAPEQPQEWTRAEDQNNVHRKLREVFLNTKFSDCAYDETSDSLVSKKRPDERRTSFLYELTRFSSLATRHSLGQPAIRIAFGSEAPTGPYDPAGPDSGGYYELVFWLSPSGDQIASISKTIANWEWVEGLQAPIDRPTVSHRLERARPYAIECHAVGQ
jgi:hypothetical protein